MSGGATLLLAVALAQVPAGGAVPAGMVDTIPTLAVRPEPRVRFDAALVPRGAVVIEAGSQPASAVDAESWESWDLGRGNGSIPSRVEPLVADTPTSPPPLIEYTDAYYKRLQIHKWASWAILPVFALQYVSGQKLADEAPAPGWARDVHGPAAAGVAALFGVNTVTGVWNMWDARQDPYGRKWRTAHSVLMLLADAGFVATGMLAEDAGEEGEVGAHRTVALTSMGVALASWVMMLPPLRRD